MPVLNEISVTGDYSERLWCQQVHDGIESKRNSIVIAHRRAGKTVCVVAECIRQAFGCPHWEPQVAYIAPTAKQARNVAWHYFVWMLTGVPGVTFRRHELVIELPNGGRILFASGEGYDRLRGMYLDFALVDEGADCPEAMIDEVLRPALADRKGKLCLIGTVKGRNAFYQQYEAALEDPDWFAAKFLPEDTNVIPLDELEYLKRQMSDDSYKQEMLCDPDAAVRGAYYGKLLADNLDKQTNVPLDPGLGVTVGMDLGIADSTAVWFAQLHRGGEIRLLDYREYQNTGFIQIIKELRQAYTITRWVGPHDLAVREYTSGQSRLDAARDLGVHFEVAPRMPVIDGIEAVRRALPRCFFDKTKCKQGLESLSLFRSQYDETKRVLSRNPLHDYTSHGADAMRYLITGTVGGQENLLSNLPKLDYSKVNKRRRA